MTHCKCAFTDPDGTFNPGEACPIHPNVTPQRTPFTSNEQAFERLTGSLWMITKPGGYEHLNQLGRVYRDKQMALRHKDFDEVVVELRLADEMPVSGGPIATAPIDGTHFLGWSAEYGWRETYCDTYKPGSPGYAQGLTDRWWVWNEEIHNSTHSWKPTHWLPLPSVVETSEIYTQDVLDAAHARTRERLSKLKIDCGNPVMVNTEWYGPCTRPSGHDGDCAREAPLTLSPDGTQVGRWKPLDIHAETKPNEIEVFDGESHIHRLPAKTPAKPCPNCFGDKTICMNDGSKRTCEYCGGSGVDPVQKAPERPIEHCVTCGMPRDRHSDRHPFQSNGKAQ